MIEHNVPHNDDLTIKLPDQDVADFNTIISSVNDYMKWHKSHPNKNVVKDLGQFHKSWFYNNWTARFRHLQAFSNLGTKGVIAIPNTTFEEWLWWFHEWAEALTDDYNQFKKLVYDALVLIQKHLEAIDQELAEHERWLRDHEQRITTLEKQMKEVQQHLQKLDQDVKNLGDEITNTRQEFNKKLGDVNNVINNLTEQQAGSQDTINKIIQKLTDAGAWDPNTNDFKPGFGIACGNINLFGGSPDGSSYIRTNSGQSENDITAGI